MRIGKKEKEQLQQAFSVPVAKNKKKFLRTLPKQKVGLGTLILSQAAYIRAWVWAVSFLMFGMAVFAAWYMEQDVIWVLSAFMPFAATASAISSQKEYISENEVVPDASISAMPSSAEMRTQLASIRSSTGKIWSLSQVCSARSSA